MASTVATGNMDVNMSAAAGTTNTEVGNGSLASMFAEGQQNIAVTKTGDLFAALGERSLTEAEEAIIKQRVDHQRKMLEMFERQDQRRKISELREVCPSLSEEEAEMALKMSGGKEDRAAGQLTSDPRFVARVKAAVHGYPAPKPRAAGTTRRPSSAARLEGPRPKLVDMAKVDGSVFCGSFRGRGAAKGVAKVSRKIHVDAAPGGVDEPMGDLEDKTMEEEEQPLGEVTFHDGETGMAYPENAPQDGSGTSGDEAAEETPISFEDSPQCLHRLVRVMEDGQLVPVSSTGLKKARAALEDCSLEEVNEDGGRTGSPSASTFELVMALAKPLEKETVKSQVEKLLTLEAGVQQRAASQLNYLCPESAMQRREELAARARSPVNDAKKNERAVGKKKALMGKAQAKVTDSGTGDTSEGALRDVTNVKAEAGLAEAFVDGPQTMPGDNGDEKAAGEAPSAPPTVSSAARMAAFALSKLPVAKQRQRLMGMAEEMRVQVAAQLDFLYPNTGADRAVVDPSPPVTSSAPAVTAEAKAEEPDSDADFVTRPPSVPRKPRSAPFARRRASVGLSGADAPTVTPEESAAPVQPPKKPKSSAAATKSKKPVRKQLSLKKAFQKSADKQKARVLKELVQEDVAAAAEMDESDPVKDTAEVKNQESPKAKGGPDGKRPTCSAVSASVDTVSAPIGGCVTATDAVATEAQSKTPTANKKPTEGTAVTGSNVQDAAEGSDADKGCVNKRTRTNSGRLGRVRQKSQKQVDLVEVGSLSVEHGWHNQGYIFPDGFHSRTLFRSSVDVDQVCIHECYVLGQGGQYWPKPTFKVVALDRPDEPLIAQSCTGCWTQVLKRINAVIMDLIQAGEDRPAPPKTAIAGPEYFGLSNTEIVEQIEQLDPERQCGLYWEGREERDAIKAGLVVPNRPPAPKRASGAPRPPRAERRGRSKRTRYEGADSDVEQEEEEAVYANRWSSVSRSERYKKRSGDMLDEDNPLPDFMDPITLEQVVAPAISPYGHVMGSATWKAVLAEQGKCPFTQAPLTWGQIKVLNKNNIDSYRHLIKK